MSSLIEWPSIYGSSYFVPAVVVVVLLLALLLLMSSRRRRAIEAVRDTTEPFEEADTLPPAAVAESVPAEPAATSADGAAAMAPVTQWPAMAQPVIAQPTATPAAARWRPAAVAAPSAEMAVLPAAAAAAVPVAAVATQPSPAAAPIPHFGPLASGRDIKVTVRTQGPVSGAGVDPLDAALLDILNGWGDLTPEDTKRLELFRPERLSAALAAIQLPKSKSNEAKARLSQLRQYSADLEHRALTAQTAAAAQAAAAVVPAPIAPAAPMAPAAPAVPAPAVAAAAVAPAVAAGPVSVGFTSAAPAASLGSITVAAAPAAGDPAVAAVSSGGPAAGLAAVAALGAASRTTSQSDTKTSPETSPGSAEVAAAGAATVTSSHSAFDDLASFWAEPRPLWEQDKDVSFEELPAPTYHEVEVRPGIKPAADVEPRPNGNGSPVGPKDATSAVLSGAGLNAAAPVAAPSIVAPPVAAPTRPPLTSIDTYFWDDMPTDPLSRMSVKVETAEQLLALPPHERIDMAAFLEPSELAATFRATKDPELKKAVIDTLEHIGSPSSLNALGNCFEDSNSDIQLYALEAADRLLGVA